MSVRIRFKRVGRPRAPYYRLVAIDRQNARDGKPIEILGAFNSRNLNKPEYIHIDRIWYWISTGALPTDTVQHTLKRVGVWDQVKPGAAKPVPAQ